MMKSVCLSLSRRIGLSSALCVAAVHKRAHAYFYAQDAKILHRTGAFMRLNGAGSLLRLTNVLC